MSIWYKLFLIIILSKCIYSQCDVFSQPSPCCAEELAVELDKKTLDMTWYFGPESYFRFVSKMSAVYFEVRLEKGTDVLHSLKDRFIKVDGGFVFTYELTAEGREEINRPVSFEKKQHPDHESYAVADRRVFERANPAALNPAELVEIIKDRPVLFYTGAGLSQASDISGMNELNALLEIDSDSPLFLSERVFDNPKELAVKILDFHKACLFSAPTPAHFALRDIAEFKGVRIITENLDCLHESSGIYPYRIEAHHVRDEVGGACLASYDYIICIGLSYDDRGFLGWFKKNNPQGKIISVDLHQPSYLSDEDFFVEGDLQELIPRVKTQLISD